MDVGKLNERTELLVLQEANQVFRWETVTSIWAKAKQKGKTSLFSKVEIGENNGRSGKARVQTSTPLHLSQLPARCTHRSGRPTKDRIGQVTRVIEGGHRIRPAGKSKGRANVAFVNGYHFYNEISQRAESIAIAEAEAWADERVAELEAVL